MPRRKDIEEWRKILVDSGYQIDILSEHHKGRHRILSCKCRICGQTFDRDACTDSLLRGCKYCYGQGAIPNVSDIYTTANWMVKYLKDPSIAFQYKAGSMIKTTFKCPLCGYEKESAIDDVYQYGFYCPQCSDKLTKPNKFLRKLLSQLKVDNVIYEYHSEWTQGRRYDVYFELNGEKYIIEMDGDQHRRNTTWSTLEKQSLIDHEKDSNANQAGIHLIRIKAKIYKYDDWIEQFNNCEIGDFIKSSNVDWYKCIKETETNYTKSISEYYMEHSTATLKDISDEFGICRNTASQYLKIGASLGWCNYSHEESKKRSDAFNAKRMNNQNELLDSNGNVIGTFDTYTECAKHLSMICGRKVTMDNIRYFFKKGHKFASIEGYIVRKIAQTN